MELVLDNICKEYKDKRVVDSVSLTLSPGVVGLLGANGAGKTTLMRMICGIIKPSRGNISFMDYDVSQEEYRDMLGYLPQNFGYYPNFTGEDFLMYMAALKGIEKYRARKKAEELLEMVNLKEMGKKKIKSYSGGMKQRLGIAQALLNDPKLIILDEPTSGLDPKERVKFRNIIESLGKDSIVLLSTHIVSDVEQIADRVLMMKEGSIIFDGKEWELGSDLEAFYLKEFEEN